MQYVSPTPGFGSSFFIILGVLMIIGGIVQLCRRKFSVDNKSFKNYTKQSVQKFACYSGVTFIVAGLALILGKLFRIEGTGDLLFWIGIGIALVAIIAICVMGVKIPQLKKTAKTKKKK